MTTIRRIEDKDAGLWDAYVQKHPQASVYHCWAFKNAVEKTYGHKTVYLAAFEDARGEITGALPLFLVSSPLFGKSAVSLGFCDYGGILYNDEASGKLLYEKAIELVNELRFDVLELRQTYALPFCGTEDNRAHKVRISTEKVRMKLTLPRKTDELFSSFPGKLRSQIRKPQKDGCTIKSGGPELLDDFYSVFVYNMRDLGSPVHSKKMMVNVLHFYGTRSRLFVVYKGKKPVACSLAVGMGNALVNPWASFDKRFRASAPNMLLYWGMLEFAMQNGYASFDFGRSTKEEGTYRFKEQWGALPEPLYWYYCFRTKEKGLVSADGAKRGLFIKLWQRVPLPVTAMLGPIIRKRIPL
jgi:FemAB-related protein (PEP-CTERM system-associated)